MKPFSLPLRNVLRHPFRTAALALLTALLSASVFGGSVISGALERGLGTLTARLGADVIVLPASAGSRVSFEKLFLQGTVGAFYMDADALAKARETPGVEAAAAQTFLASLKADCCSIRIQIIGFDPDTDFIVQPWIAERLSEGLGDMEVAVGCKVEAGVGETLVIYDQRCKVAAMLAPTGTGLDTAVYCSMKTMNALLAAAEAKGITHAIESSEDGGRISAVYVKVKDGYDVDEVTSRLNRGIRRATAVRTRSMITGVSDGLSAVKRTARVLTIAVWLIALAVLVTAYAMMVRERRREFAVLAMLGFSRRALAASMLKESALCSLLGAAAGVLVGALAVFPFSALIESRLGLPYLSPGPVRTAALALFSVLLSSAAGALSGFFAALSLSRADPGGVLREGA